MRSSLDFWSPNWKITDLCFKPLNLRWFAPAARRNKYTGPWGYIMWELLGQCWFIEFIQMTWNSAARKRMWPDKSKRKMKRAWTVNLRTKMNDGMKQIARQGVRKIKGRVGSYVGSRLSGSRLALWTVRKMRGRNAWLRRDKARICLIIYSSGNCLIGGNLTIHHVGSHGSMYDVSLYLLWHRAWPLM